jgi:peptidyl-prolyl cis-trans isomerase D
MLQKLREKTSGWIAVAIVAMLAVPFAFFGVENYFTQQVSTYVAKVGDVEIGPDTFQQRFEELRRQMQQVMGEQYDGREFESAENKRRVLDRLIDEEVLRQASERFGAIVTPAQLQREIGKIDAFKKDGKFDPSTYRNLLAAQGMTPRMFEDRVRQELATQSIPSQLAASGFVADDYVGRYLALRDQTRSFDYLVLPVPGPEVAGEIDEAQIETYFKEHADRYVDAEQVSLEYLEVDASKLEVPVSVDDETLRQRYEEQKTRYVEPEQRLASHILIKVDANADADAQKAAQAKAQTLVEQARAEGADFAALAKANSDDIGSKNTGGDLGWVEKGIFDPAFETALYALEANAVSDPVKGADGWHVIKLREIKAEVGKPFEAVRADLEREYLEGERERQFSEIGGKLVDIIYRDPSTLATAAEELKLPIQRSESFTRAGGTGIAANPKVIEAAFSDAVLVDGTVSDSIELGPDRIVVVRAVDHVPAKPQALEQARAAVTAALIAERVATKSKEDADAALETLRTGKTLADVAAARGLELKTADKVGRIGATVDPTLSQFAFGLPHPTEGKPSLGQVEVAGGRALVVLTAVSDGDPATVEAEQRTALADQLGQAVGGAEAAAFAKALRKAATIEVVESRL